VEEVRRVNKERARDDRRKGITVGENERAKRDEYHDWGEE
jgi:hypothetical protein